MKLSPEEESSLKEVSTEDMIQELQKRNVIEDGRVLKP